MQVEVIEQIRRIAEGFSGVVGVAAKSLSGKKPDVLFNAEEVFPIASTIKVAVLVELLDQADKGLVRLHDAIRLTEEDKVPGTGILKELHAGLELSVLDAAALMIVLSDNTATNMVIDQLGGVNVVNEKMDQLGLSSIRLNSRIEFEWLMEHGAEALSRSNPRDFAELLALVVRKEILTPESCQVIMSIMKKQQLNAMIPRYLPWTPYAKENGIEQQLEYGGKCGMLNGVRADAGFIEVPQETYVVSIMAKDCAEEGFKPENEGDIAVGRISRAVYDYFVA
jgi:beta-lactamase class A